MYSTLTYVYDSNNGKWQNWLDVNSMLPKELSSSMETCSPVQLIGLWQEMGYEFFGKEPTGTPGVVHYMFRKWTPLYQIVSIAIDMSNRQITRIRQSENNLDLFEVFQVICDARQETTLHDAIATAGKIGWRCVASLGDLKTTLLTFEKEV